LRAATPDSCQTLRKHGQKTEAQACYESLVRSNSAYYRAEGYWGLEQYDQANEQFRIATAPPDSDPLYKVRWGMLLHQRFNNTDAVGLFQEALQKDPKNAQAYLGLAIVSADGFDGKPRTMSAGPWCLIPSWWKRMSSRPTSRWKTRIRTRHRAGR
jgi:tetratricopeptide (TPR) repeat protein